jgi:flagellar hook-associated protein 2
MATSNIINTSSSTSANNILTQDLVDKLKAEEYKNTVKKYDDKLEKTIASIALSSAVETSISTFAGVSELLTSSNASNVFDDYSVKTTGGSATFKTTNIDIDDNISINVDVTTLSKKDVHQSNIFASKNDNAGGGSITITHKGINYTIDLTGTYEEAKEAINASGGDFIASIEQVGASQFRLVMQSKDSGVANALTIATASGATIAINNTQPATDLSAKVDGVDYALEGNTITLSNGLEIQLHSLGITTAKIEPNETEIINTLNNFISSFNNINDSLEAQIKSLNHSQLKPLDDLKDDLKDILFTTIDNRSIFSYGFALDEDGKLSFDDAKYKTLSDTQKDELKKIFLGNGINEGIGKKVDDLVDGLYKTDGVLKDFDKDLMDTKNILLAEQLEEKTKLDEKYIALEAKFSKYNAIIAGLERSFDSLQFLIDSSNDN